MTGYYDKAMQMYQELSKDNRYSLFKKGDNPYVDMFKAANDFNCEIIMALSCDPSANGDVSSGNFFPLSMLLRLTMLLKLMTREILHLLTIKEVDGCRHTMFHQNYMIVMNQMINVGL